MERVTVIPVLRIFDVAKAKEFYLDWLGFKVNWKYQFEDSLPIYMQVSKGKMILHLTEHHGDCTPGSKVFIEIIGLKEFYKEINNKNYIHNNPGIEETPWNSICMELIDPFHNKLLFNESLKK
ncbi:glyoxalase superfamily protein [Ekhidna sp.]|uniref:glyoxalase superfamily protein n=1 Tax=Ekhidna sp. TaxID=2608089 RepID=UPI0032974576